MAYSRLNNKATLKTSSSVNTTILMQKNVYYDMACALVSLYLALNPHRPLKLDKSCTINLFQL